MTLSGQSKFLTPALLILNVGLNIDIKAWAALDPQLTNGNFSGVFRSWKESW